MTATIKTWQERGGWSEYFSPNYDGMPAWECAKAEIAELRAALEAANAQLAATQKPSVAFTLEFQAPESNKELIDGLCEIARHYGDSELLRGSIEGLLSQQAAQAEKVQKSGLFELSKMRAYATGSEQLHFLINGVFSYRHKSIPPNNKSWPADPMAGTDVAGLAIGLEEAFCQLRREKEETEKDRDRCKAGYERAVQQILANTEHQRKAIAALPESIRAVRTAVEENDGDTLGLAAPDDAKVWVGEESLTIGHLRNIAAAYYPPPDLSSAEKVQDDPEALAALSHLQRCLEIGTGCIPEPDSRVVQTFEHGWSGGEYMELTMAHLRAIGRLTPAEKATPEGWVCAPIKPGFPPPTK